MNGIRIGDFRRCHEARDIQVAFLAGGRADTNGLICKADMKRVTIGLGVDRNGLDSDFTAGTNHAEGNLAPVGYQNFLEQSELTGNR